jgi:hypothetical protein
VDAGVVPPAVVLAVFFGPQDANANATITSARISANVFFMVFSPFLICQGKSERLPLCPYYSTAISKKQYCARFQRKNRRVAQSAL